MKNDITPGDLPPAFTGGSELTAIILFIVSVVCLVLAVVVFGIFL